MPLNEWRAGWPVVLGAGLGYGTGGAMIIMLSGLFIKPMRDALNWSTTAVTFMPIVLLVWALCNFLVGPTIDRFGSRAVGLCGMIGMTGCALLLGVMPISQPVFYAIAGLMGAFGSMTSVTTYTRGVASWFRSSVGLAFGIALSGSALIAIIATPLIGTIIGDHGWRAGFFALAGVIAFVGFPVVALFYRERGAPAKGAPAETAVAGKTLIQALRDYRFWCYALAFTLANIPLNGTATHLQPMLAEKSFPLAEALSLGVVFAVAISIGKVFGGMLLDRFWPFAVAAAFPLISAAGSFALAGMDGTMSFPALVLIVGSIGLTGGAEADFIGFFILRTFGMRVFATIVGIMATTVTFGTALGGWLYGRLFDTYGDYEFACMVGTICLACAAVVILVAGLGDHHTNKFYSDGGLPSAR